MKATNFIFFLLFFSLNCKANYTQKDTLNVFALNGLNLRIHPESSSKKIKTLAFGSFVVVIDTHEFSLKDTIEKRTGNWIEVQFKEYKGFVFDGFLSELPVPDMNDINESPIISLSNYFNNNFKEVYGPIKIIEPYYDLDGNDSNQFALFVLTGGIKKRESYGYEDWWLDLYFPNTRFSELISLVEILLSKNSIYQQEFKNKLNQYNSSIDLLHKTKENSTIKIFFDEIRLIDSIGPKVISFTGGGKGEEE